MRRMGKSGEEGGGLVPERPSRLRAPEPPNSNCAAATGTDGQAGCNCGVTGRWRGRKGGLGATNACECEGVPCVWP